SRFITGDEIQTHIVARPALPETVIRIGDYSDERNAFGETQLLQHAREDVLRQRMHADDDVRAPALKQFAHVTDASRMKELARLWPKAINQPVVVLHPVLFVAQQPVVNGD